MIAFFKLKIIILDWKPYLIMKTNINTIDTDIKI